MSTFHEKLAVNWKNLSTYFGEMSLKNLNRL